MKFRVGQFVWFAGYRCQVKDVFNGDGTPCPSTITIRVVQRWYQFAAPPIEYVIGESREKEIATIIGKA